MSNLKAYTLPDDLIADSSQPAEGIHIMPYQSEESIVKNRVTLHHNLFSFLIAGEKRVYYAENQAGITSKQFLLLSGGNCLMSEKSAAGNGIYKSVLLFFDNKALTGFFLKYPHIFTDKVEKSIVGEPFVVFTIDDFLENYVRSLSLILASGKALSEDMRQLKFEELMLYMAAHYPQQILSLRTSLQQQQDDFVIRRSAETNLLQHVTIEELAFLCNMSISTYKRRFAKVYGTPPNKWFLQKKMELAATMLLNQGEKPSEVYHKVGYENHSSFTQSFKQIYGVTPSEYQQQKQTV
jgi:AraC-like DNA-binding protein